MSTDQAIEQQIQAVGANVAPRITPDDIKANIASEHYFTAADGVVGAFTNAQIAQGRGVYPDEIGKLLSPLGLLTFCVLVLRNGFTVTGESACASPENFNAEIGRRIARENAVAKVWPLMGYELRTRIADRAGSAAVESLVAKALTPYTINDIVAYETSNYGQEWTARFSDGTQVSIAVEMFLDKLRDNAVILQRCVNAHNEATGGKSA